MNRRLSQRNPVGMNATASAQAVITRAMGRPHVLPPEPASACRESASTASPPRLPVWEERARKMGFPPSAR